MEMRINGERPIRPVIERKDTIFSGITTRAVMIMLLAAVLLYGAGCSSMDRLERYKPIMGYWKTNRDVIVSIQNTPEHGIGAYVMKAPGHLGPEAKPDAPVIVDIRPRSRTTFDGKFLMPGESKPVKVHLILTGRNTLSIMSRDKRVQKRMMRWQRIRKP